MNEEKTARTPGRADYAGRQEARKERLEVAADKARCRSEESFEASRAETRHIPMGQPILIGHHSESRHRNALKRSDNKMRASIQYNEQANVLESRAAGVGRGGVSADDPEVIQKLKARITDLEGYRDEGKRLNKSLNKHKKKLEGDALVEALIADGIKEETARLLATPCRNSGRLTGVAVTPHTKEIRRLNERIELIQEELEAGEFGVITGTIEGIDWKAYGDEDENRICIEFESRTSKDLARWMKQQGYNFSRTHERWQRQLNKQGRNTTKWVAQQLKEKAGAEHA